MGNRNARDCYLSQLEYDLNNLLVYYTDLELLQIIVRLLGGDVLSEE